MCILVKNLKSFLMRLMRMSTLSVRLNKILETIKHCVIYCVHFECHGELDGNMLSAQTFNHQWKQTKATNDTNIRNNDESEM